MHEVLVVVMMRFWAVTGSSCLVMSSCMVSLTSFWLAEILSLLTVV